MKLPVRPKKSRQLNSVLPRRRSGAVLGRAIGISIVLVLLLSAYTLSGQPVQLVVNDQAYHVRTHYQTVERLVSGMELELEPEDIIQPQLSASLSPGDVVTIDLARPVTVVADGKSRQLLTQHDTIDYILSEADLVLHPVDEILVEGARVPLDSSLPAAKPTGQRTPAKQLFATTTPSGAILSSRPEPVRITVDRAIPITVIDEQAVSTFYTARDTVNEALQEQGIMLFPEDRVRPGLDASLARGLRVFIDRSTPVTVIVDGQIIETRTHQETVAEVIGQLGISLVGQDYSRPAPDHVIAPNEAIEITRVRESLEIEQEFIPFETEWIADDTMLLDQQEVRQAGGTGVIKTR